MHVYFGVTFCSDRFVEVVLQNVVRVAGSGKRRVWITKRHRRRRRLGVTKRVGKYGARKTWIIQHPMLKSRPWGDGPADTKVPNFSGCNSSGLCPDSTRYCFISAWIKDGNWMPYWNWLRPFLASVCSLPQLDLTGAAPRFFSLLSFRSTKNNLQFPAKSLSTMPYDPSNSLAKIITALLLLPSVATPPFPSTTHLCPSWKPVANDTPPKEKNI